MGKNCSVQANKFQHQNLGLLHLLPGRAGDCSRVQLRRQVDSLRKYNEWERELQMYLQEDFREVFYLPEQYAFVGEGMCGTGGYVKMEFEYYKYSLKSQITSRHHSRVAFDQTELWYLLYNLLEAAFLLQPLCRRIGDVHPKNIVLNEKGRIKIIPQALFPNGKANYQQIVQDRTADVFLAPEEMDEDMIERGIYPPIDALKAEVFSIGVTLLMAASLRNSYYLYDRKVLKFSSAKRYDYMAQVTTTYSPYFCSILNQLLQEDAKKRRTSREFFGQLNRYQDDILSLRKFQQIEAKLKQAFQDKQESFEPSIADILNKNERGGSHISPEISTINNIHSF